ncbi:CsbD family protein [Caballeronia sp. LZ043]|uniref:CsbD family protein n=1 Tax=Caballeronia sp. LZ043 TaxID=3038569 RepID=UPI00285F8E5F|nr:CsbD family protein [Caballeronia sp. LZ043]MDR5821463.1 CsbD family protein [Caballeronia sp. LZ043]
MFERTEGTIQKAAGKAQAALGDATNDASTQVEGLARQAAGAAQQTYGKALSTVRHVTKENPVISLGCIAVAAFALGALWARR